MTSREEIERLDDEWMSAFNRQDWDAFVALLADDFVWHDWSAPEPMRDKDVIHRYFNQSIVAFPDMQVKQTRRVVGDDAVAAEIEYAATNTGPMMMGENEIPPTGKAITGRGSYLAFVREGKFVEMSSHPDIAGMMMQLGFMPGM